MQFRTKQSIDLQHLRVFGCPAQIFVRATTRQDKKLSDRSVSGTFVGISTKGNGYIFLVNSTNRLAEFVELDSKDVKFNETFSDFRGRQGKITEANHIAPDLRYESVTANHPNAPVNGRDSNEDNNFNLTRLEDPEERSRRPIMPRKFLIPGIHSSQEIDIRKQQYSNLCLNNIMANDDVIFITNCMEATLDEETILLKELELLTACALDTNDNAFILSPASNDGEVNLHIPDPRTQRDIDRMDPTDAKRFNDATRSEVDGMKSKHVF